MTVNHHTPISSARVPANASTVNSPLAELDAAIESNRLNIQTSVTASATLAVTAATSATTLTLGSGQASSIPVGASIDVWLDAGTNHSTTVASRDTGADTVTLTDALPSQASAGNNITTVPPEIVSARNAGNTLNGAATLAQRLGWLETALNPMAFGAVADGSSHPASEFYASNALVQAAYPLTQALHSASGTLSDIGTTTEIDYLALQECIQQAKSTKSAVHLPPSKDFYIGDGSLWCGNATNPINCLKYFNGNDSTISAAGSSVVFDWAGSRKYVFENVTIDGDATTPPDVGILFARVDETTPKSNGNSIVNNVYCDNSFAVCPVVDVALETVIFIQCKWATNVAGNYYSYSKSYTNPLGIASHYATVFDSTTHTTTNTYIKFVDCRFFQQATNPHADGACVQLEQTKNVVFDHCLFNSEATSSTMVRLDSGGTDAHGNIQFINGTNFHGDYDCAVRVVAGVQVTNLKIEGVDLNPSYTDVLLEAGATLYTPKIKIRKLDGSASGASIERGGFVDITQAGTSGVGDFNLDGAFRSILVYETNATITHGGADAGTWIDASTGTSRWAGDIESLGGMRRTYPFYFDMLVASQTATPMNATGGANPAYVLPTAGSLMAIAINTDNAITAGTVTVTAQKQTGASATWTTITSMTFTSAHNSGYYRVLAYSKDTHTLAKGDRVRVRISSDASLLPITGNFIVSLEVEG